MTVKAAKNKARPAEAISLSTSASWAACRVSYAAGNGACGAISVAFNGVLLPVQVIFTFTCL